MNPVLPLVGAVLWTLSLVFVIAGWRAVRVLRGSERANGFPSGQPHGPDWYQRLNRAHMNCVENVPLFGLVALAGATLGAPAPFALLTWIWLGARVLQTLAHVSSGRSMAVNVRFAFFVLQHLCLLWMCWQVVDGVLAL